MSPSSMPTASGQWLELTFGKNGLDASNATFAFADQADVVTHARIAADSAAPPRWTVRNGAASTRSTARRT